MKKAVVILPTYNEEGNVATLIDAIFKVSSKITNWQIEVLVVDSNSKDQTAKIIKKKIEQYPDKLHIIETEKEGLGKAYVKGFRYALENLRPYVIFEMDADWSHNPEEIPFLLKKIELGADLVIGSRYMKGGSIPKNWGFHRKLFSVFGNLIVRVGFMRFKINEWTNGYRAIKSWVVKQLLTEVAQYSGYVFQVAFIDKAINHGANIQHIPCKFSDRKKGLSKINSFQYIFQTLSYVFTHSSFIKFVIVGLTGFFIDFGFAYIFINSVRFPKAPANMLSAEMAIICNFLLNNFWSFKHKKISGGFSYLIKFLSFNFVSLGAIIIQGVGIAASLWIFGDSKINLFGILSIQSWMIYKVFLIAFLVVPYSYILYNKVVWKEK